MNERQKVNKIIHTYVDVNKYEDYTDYKGLITSLIDWKNEQLRIGVVSQQRELLIAYEIESKKPYKMSREIAEAKVTMIMKAINCG